MLERISVDVAQETTPGAPPHAFYTGRVRLPASEAAKIDVHRLRPGMPAEVYMQAETRSALSYMIRPIADNFERAMRER